MNEECFAFTEWVGLNYIRLSGVWCHKHKPQTPDNYHTTQELYDAWKKYYGE